MVFKTIFLCDICKNTQQKNAAEVFLYELSGGIGDVSRNGKSFQRRNKKYYVFMENYEFVK